MALEGASRSTYLSMSSMEIFFVSLSLLLVIGLVLIILGSALYNVYSPLYTILILMFAPIPAWIASMSTRNEFSSNKKTSAQEAGLFLTSAVATSAFILPVFLWNIEVIVSQSAAFTVSGVGAIVLAIALYQVFFNIKQESW